MRAIYRCTICGAYTENSIHCGSPAKLVIDGYLRSKLSHLMTYLLRHNPKVINLLMDNEGWVGIDELVTQ